jgi:hypothetical protein
MAPGFTAFRAKGKGAGRDAKFTPSWGILQAIASLTPQERYRNATVK